jgi:hypothetical protein
MKRGREIKGEGNSLLLFEYVSLRWKRNFREEALIKIVCRLDAIKNLNSKPTSLNAKKIQLMSNYMP